MGGVRGRAGAHGLCRRVARDPSVRLWCAHQPGTPVHDCTLRRSADRVARADPRQAPRQRPEALEDRSRVHRFHRPGQKHIRTQEGSGTGHAAPGRQGHEEVRHRQPGPVHRPDCELVRRDCAIGQRTAAHGDFISKGRRFLGRQPSHRTSHPPWQRPHQRSSGAVADSYLRQPWRADADQPYPDPVWLW